jgi:hypothetical protein
VNELRHTIENFENRLTSDNLRLSERYIESKVKIRLPTALVSAHGQPNDFMAVYQRFSEYGHFVPTIEFNPNSDLFYHASNSENEAMFVNTVKLIEMQECVISSNVWLYSFEDFVSATPNLVYFSPAKSRCELLGTLRAVADRKVGIPVRNDSASLHELPNKMIQGTPRVMDSIANSERNVVGNRTDIINAQAYLSGIGIILGDKCIKGIGVAERLNSEIQIVDVLFGPFNF